MRTAIFAIMAVVGPALAAGPAGTFDIVDGYANLGCYSEPAGARALTGSHHESDKGMTADYCAEACAGSKYFGVEYSTQCFCGAALEGGAPQPDAAQCDLTCSGDPTLNCGGHNHLNLFIAKPPTTTLSTKTTTASPTPTGFSYVGCFKDKKNMIPIMEGAAMNPSICMAAAKAKALAATPTKFIYIAVEAGSICVGATSEPAKPTSLIGPKACTSTCVGIGNAAQTCGGKKQLGLYASVTGSAFSAPVKTKAA